MGSSVDGVALRAARERAGLTQHELARRVGVAGGERVARWERGVSEPRPDTLAKIAGELGVRARELVALEGDRPDLRALRLIAGLDSAVVSDHLHVTVATYLRWERGSWSRQPSDAIISGLADALGVADATVLSAMREARDLAQNAPDE